MGSGGGIPHDGISALLKKEKRDSKMASVVPLKEKRLMDVKLRDLPSWILMWDFIPKGIGGAF